MEKCVGDTQIFFASSDKQHMYVTYDSVVFLDKFEVSLFEKQL